MVPPAEFIPVAEDTGLINPLGGLMLVTDALKASGLPPRRLELEITETLLLEKSAQVLATMPLRNDAAKIENGPSRRMG